MSKRTLWIMAIALSIAGIGATAWAQTGVINSGQSWRNLPIGRLIQGQIGRLMTLRAQLNLSDEQRSEIRSIVQTQQPQISKLLNQLVEQRRSLRDQAMMPTPDEQAIQKTAEQMSKTITEAAILGGNLRQQIMDVLTAEQRALLTEAQVDRQDAVDKWLSELAKP
ncbi:MAG: Spy/CpxP family protein refolding chaperone [Phycisphaeraceae bacterium JB051]